MHIVEFVATEHITGEVELDLKDAVNFNEASELAVKEIRQMYPEYDNVEVVLVKEI